VKILVAVDGSRFTRHAVNYLTRHPRVFGPKPETVATEVLAHCTVPVLLVR